MTDIERQQVALYNYIGSLTNTELYNILRSGRYIDLHQGVPDLGYRAEVIAGFVEEYARALSGFEHFVKEYMGDEVSVKEVNLGLLGGVFEDCLRSVYEGYGDVLCISFCAEVNGRIEGYCAAIKKREGQMEWAERFQAIRDRLKSAVNSETPQS